MIAHLISRWIHPPRVISQADDTPEEIDAFIDSRALECATQSDDAFVERALKLGVGSGMVLDVGTRAGLIVLKILWQNENFFSIGVDASSAMIDRARETANAWGLGERAFFQVGDARRMRLKTGYFDLVVSDGVFHRFSDPISVLSEIGRVLKPKGGLLIRDFRRPNRFKMARDIAGQAKNYGSRMRPQIEEALRGAYTPAELRELLKTARIEGARVIEIDEHYICIEREGMTDPNSWVSVREQYR
jgi:ubiquinone/menaquinone biosynthesis C-methylase UbiE